VLQVDCVDPDRLAGLPPDRLVLELQNPAWTGVGAHAAADAGGAFHVLVGFGTSARGAWKGRSNAATPAPAGRSRQRTWSGPASGRELSVRPGREPKPASRVPLLGGHCRRTCSETTPRPRRSVNARDWPANDVLVIPATTTLRLAPAHVRLLQRTGHGGTRTMTSRRPTSRCSRLFPWR